MQNNISNAHRVRHPIGHRVVLVIEPQEGTLPVMLIKMGGSHFPDLAKATNGLCNGFQCITEIVGDLCNAEKVVHEY